MSLLCLLIFGFVAVPVLSAAEPINYEKNSEPSGASSTNAVENLSPDLLERFNVSLSFYDIQLKDLPEGFIKSEFLTHLNLYGIQIESISPLAFQYVPRLSHLDLKNNLLQNIDLDQFATVENLQSLNLNGNCKTKEMRVPEIPSYSRQIERHGFSSYYGGHVATTTTPRSRIILTPCGINISVQLPSLTELYLENNDLERLTFSEGVNLPLLRRLYLSSNKLDMDNNLVSSLRDSVPSLSELHLMNSSITRFDASQLPLITSLFLDGNRLTSVCNEYCEVLSLKLKDARNLETLSVSKNQISNIEADSFNCTTSLVTLDLSNNQISEIREGTFDKLHLLRSLSLEYNNLVKLNALHAFRGLIRMENLSLGGNHMTNIEEGAFGNLFTLKTLNLDHNEISDIDSGTFSNLTSLETLSLARNQLSRISDGCMPSSGSLITLNLNNNNFITTEHISLTDLPNLLMLLLKDNPLTTISLNWHSVASKSLRIAVGTTCSDE